MLFTQMDDDDDDDDDDDAIEDWSCTKGRLTSLSNDRIND